MEHYHREGILLAVSIPLYLFFIGLEMLVSNLHADGRYSKRGFFQNAYILVVNMIIDGGMRTLAFLALVACFKHSLFHFSSPVFYWVTLVLLQDLAFYTMHLVDHKVRLFWAVHVTHHNSEEYNLSVGFRSSVFEPLYRFVYFTPIALMGYNPMDIFFIFSFTQLYGVFVHTQYIKKLGFLEWFMVTPSHHRVHHGRNDVYIDRNMGMFLIIWDKLFGTFVPEGEAVVYGITKPPKNHKPVHTITHEFENMIADVRQAPDLRSKLLYIFGPPGWSHETEANSKIEDISHYPDVTTG